MGYRTVVILNNDIASEWESDKDLGVKISRAMLRSHVGLDGGLQSYGEVGECVHADTQTLALIDGLNFKPLATRHWSSEAENEEVQVALLKHAAYSLGYRLSKIPERK